MARPKPAMLIACMPLLLTIKELGSYGVYAENIVQAGMAVEGGYARAEDDYEGPRLYLTDEGKRAVAVAMPKRS